MKLGHIAIAACLVTVLTACPPPEGDCICRSVRGNGVVIDKFKTEAQCQEQEERFVPGTGECQWKADAVAVPTEPI